jgi:excisionase family DNA binding protein
VCKLVSSVPGEVTVQVKDPLLTSRELADYLSVPLKTVYVWASRGGGPDRIKVGRWTRYRLSAVDEWLEANKHTRVSA